MSITRLTKERIYQDSSAFNDLLPYAKWDEEFMVFLHSDASLWSVWELDPLLLTATSDADAFQTTRQMQEMLDSLDHRISLQLNWIVTFEVADLLNRCMDDYPRSGVGGWMAQRWVKAIHHASHNAAYSRRPRRMRLFASFRYDPAWQKRDAFSQMMRTISLMFTGRVGAAAMRRREEYEEYATKFQGEINGKITILNDLGLGPRRVDGQGLVDLMYPILNRRTTKSGKFKRGRSTAVPVPTYDKRDLLVNQVSETHMEHPENGIIKKDGLYFRSVSMVKPPKRCFPLMIAPLQSAPYEHILSVTFSRDALDKQLKRLDALDSTLGFREFTARGRSNQKVQQQIASIRAARQELYTNSAQLVKVGVHQTFICGDPDEAIRATSEAVATMTHLHGARGMVHEISDLGVLLQSMPAAYDPSTDGHGWTNMMRSSRATRLFPLWGNWKGSKGAQFLLPSLWNRELVGFDLFDSNIAPNCLISGVSGAGKSYLLCYLITTLNRGHYATLADGKTVERPPITFVFDKGMANQPCGFEKIAKLFGGRIYEATPSRAPAMNFLARLGETPHDFANQDFKDLVDLCADIIIDMASEGERKLDRLQRSAVVNAVIEAHRFYRNGPRKREFILSDVAAILRAPRRVDEDEDSAKRRNEIAILAGDYYGEGTYARFFDRPGALKLRERFIVFDLKSLNRNPDLQRIFLKIAMLWADEVMNDPNELDSRKILVFDEAHDLIGQTASGVIESAFRLYRKRKGMVIAASQSGEDFYAGQGGQAIVQNSAHKIFLRQDPSKFHMTAQAFNLSEQQSDVILRLRTIKGVESQFYMISDIGEGALVLPLEPSYYWVSTNNGDDNQLFKAVLEQCDNDFWLALQRVVQLAPNGAAAFMRAREDHELAQREEQEQAPTPFSNALDTAFGTVERSSANQ